MIVGTGGLSRWSPDTRQIVWTLPGPAGDVLTLPDKTIVIGHESDVSLLSPDGRVLDKLLPHAPKTLTGLLGLDRDRRWLAAPSADGFIDLYEIKTRTRVASIPSKSVERSPIITPDGQRLLVERS